MIDPTDNPMNHPEEQPVGGDGIPHFGRLLLVLGGAVAFIVALVFVVQAVYHID